MRTEKAFTRPSSRPASTGKITREYKRTHGISTTDITERILNLDNPPYWEIDERNKEHGTKIKRFYSSMSKFVQFFDNRVVNTYFQGKIVYVTGTFDLLRKLIRFGPCCLFERGPEARRLSYRRNLR